MFETAHVALTIRDWWDRTGDVHAAVLTACSRSSVQPWRRQGCLVLLDRVMGDSPSGSQQCQSARSRGAWLSSNCQSMCVIETTRSRWVRVQQQTIDC